MHRDIKPANVLLGQNGDCKLADFGTAAMLTHLEMDGETLIGTPHYMAPEVTEGQLGSAMDIWAVGATCVHLLTGRKLLDMISMDSINPMNLTASIRSQRDGRGIDLGASLCASVDTAQGNNVPRCLFLLSMMERSPELPSTVDGDARTFVDSCLRLEPKDRPSAGDLLQSTFLMYM